MIMQRNATRNATRRLYKQNEHRHKFSGVLIFALKSLFYKLKRISSNLETLLTMVGVTRLELAAPRPPVWCATTCATPRSISNANALFLWCG